MATHCSVLAWKTPWTGELGGCNPWDHKQSDTSEQLRMAHHGRDILGKRKCDKYTFSNVIVGVTEAEDIKKRWQEYTEELYKKDLHDPDNHDDVITNLEPDILEYEVKWV